jgi:pyruvate/2-oxoglutarate dehydrogenase complex dihydrolipoamide dehydrogenase (E3) component
LVLAVGVRPNIELVKDAGGKSRTRHSDRPQTAHSLENVWAAGDCTESDDITCCQSRILALLPNAYRQGETAASTWRAAKASFDSDHAMNAWDCWDAHHDGRQQHRGVFYRPQLAAWKSCITATTGHWIHPD